jgi:hypothetical protein
LIFCHIQRAEIPSRKQNTLWLSSKLHSLTIYQDDHVGMSNNPIHPIMFWSKYQRHSADSLRVYSSSPGRGRQERPKKGKTKSPGGKSLYLLEWLVRLQYVKLSISQDLSYFKSPQSYKHRKAAPSDLVQEEPDCQRS